jgi:hypothetical protein
MFFTLFLIFIKLLPVLSVTEVKERCEEPHDEREATA